jgi:hypothetical protein
MAKNPKNERDSAAFLCARLLQVRVELLSKRSYKDSHDRHLRELVGITLWKDSEADGKIKGCRYWSRGALSAQKFGTSTDLRHEHVFPKKQLIELLFGLPNPAYETVRVMLEELNIAAVVTREEHRVLSSIPGTQPDVWQRYRIAGIDWLDCAPK